MTSPNTRAALGTVTPGGTDDYGNPVPASITWTVLDAIWWPGGSSERVNGQDQVTWANTVCFPAGTVVKATDKVIPVPVLDADGDLVLGDDGVTPLSADGGKPFQVDGQPSAYPANTAGWQHPYSVVCALTRTTG